MYGTRPLIEVVPVMDIYADSVGEVEDLGDNFRTIYFTFTRVEAGGPLERVVCAKLIRPKRSWRVGTVARMLLQAPAPELCDLAKLSH